MIAIQKGSEPEGLAQLRQKAIDEELSPKESYALLKNPLKGQVRDRLVEEQGKIDAMDPDVQFDLIHTLNLNCASSPLIAERKAALESLINEMDLVSDEDLSAYCSDILKSFQAETNPKTPYAGILIWYLQSMVSAMDCSD